MQLGQLQQKLDEFESHGFQVIGICPDAPEQIKSSPKLNDLDIPVLSDASMAASRAFGISFRLDDKTYKIYQQYGIDLEKSSGHPHRQLPVPAIFFVEQDATISFQYVNPNYRARPGADLIVAAARDCARKRG